MFITLKGSPMPVSSHSISTTPTPFLWLSDSHCLDVALYVSLHQ